MKLTLAFDIDGTLLNKNGEIQNEVLPIFSNKKILDCNIIFCTGNSYKIVTALKEKLAEKFPYLKNLKTYASTNIGTLLFSKDDELIFDSTFEKASLKEDIKHILKIDKNTIFLITTKDAQLVSAKTSKENLDFIQKFIQHEQAKGAIGMNIILKKESPLKILKKEEKVYGLVAKSTKNVEIYDYLIKKYANKNYGIYLDTYFDLIQMTASTKWESLKQIVELEKENKDFPNDAQDIIYFGDSNNDIEPMKNCKLSYARGKDLKPEVIDSAKYYVNDLSDVSEKLFEKQ